jgi:hypothetical protein
MVEYYDNIKLESERIPLLGFPWPVIAYFCCFFFFFFFLAGKSPEMQFQCRCSFLPFVNRAK